MGSAAPRVVIVGGGVGGLAAAADLARRGADVTLLERADALGGKIRRAQVGGRSVDVGPTVLTMRWVFESLFDDAGTSLARYVDLAPAPRIAQHVWSDGARLDLFTDAARSIDAVAQLAGPAEARRFAAFCAYARRILETVDEPFLRAQRPTAWSMARAVGSLGLGALSRIDAHRTMWRALSASFESPRLRQLFARYATYCGSSPFHAPATLNVIAEVERAGVWLVEGGMARLAAGLAALAVRCGARVRTQAEVAEIIVGARVGGVILRSGERVEADAVVVNADAAAVATGLLGSAAARAVKVPRARSFSALTFAIAAKSEGLALAHHNVFFSDDYEAELHALEEDRLPSQPTVYVCAQDRERRGFMDGAEERLFCIVNAPAVGDRARPSPEEIDACERATFTQLARCGLQLHPRAMVRTTPADFARLYPGTGGALYGAASHGALSSLARPGSRTKIPGLYLAGGSAHPGPGLPMATWSGRLAASALLEDFASMRPSIAADTVGSTSTP